MGRRGFEGGREGGFQPPSPTPPLKSVRNVAELTSMGRKKPSKAMNFLGPSQNVAFLLLFEQDCPFVPLTEEEEGPC